MSQTETVQYFQFDGEGNMFIYPPGAGVSGVPKLVRPGDEMIFNSYDTEVKSTLDISSQVSDKITEETQDTQISQVSTQRDYNAPLDDDEMERLSHKDFSHETKKKMRWVLKMFTEWRSYHNLSASLDHVECDLHDKGLISVKSLNFAIPRFISEVKKLDGSDFPGKTLYDIVICIQFHLESIGFAWKLLNHDTFREIRFTLDNLMKLRVSQGIGTSVHQASVLSAMDEEDLWSLGLLGWDTPDKLLNTVVYLVGKGFALRAGKEHYC